MFEFSSFFSRLSSLIRPSGRKAPMDIYASTLSPALDIGAGCYLLLLSKLKAVQGGDSLCLCEEIKLDWFS